MSCSGGRFRREQLKTSRRSLTQSEEFHDIELNRRIVKLEEEVLDLTRDKRRAEEKIEETEKALKIKLESSVSRQRLLVEGRFGR
jgi:hypothetical protein